MASPARRTLAAPLSGMACTGDESNDSAARTAAAAKTITDLRIASSFFYQPEVGSLFALVERRNDCLRTFLRNGKTDRRGSPQLSRKLEHENNSDRNRLATAAIGGVCTFLP
jgi:hypothetical protein